MGGLKPSVRFRCAVAALTGIALLVPLIGGPARAAGIPAKAKVVTGTFVGAAKGSPAYVAVYADEADKKGRRHVVAYVCDGRQLAEWFDKKRATGNKLSLTSGDGARLRATLTKSRANGAITLADGTRIIFEVARAKRPAGLYRAEQSIAGRDYLGGWIVLPDGTQLGDLIVDGVRMAVPLLNPTSPRVDLPGIGTLTAARVRD